jgi:hypothetical protein
VQGGGDTQMGQPQEALMAQQQVQEGQMAQQQVLK